MTNKTKIIIGASVVALVGGYFIYKALRPKKPINNAIGDKDGKRVVPPPPPPIKEELRINEEKKRFAVDPIKPIKPTIEEVKEMNRLIALP